MNDFSVLIPTYKRPVDLGKCLKALELQTRKPIEVIVVRRDDDTESRDVIGDFKEKLLICEVIVQAPGVVHAMNMGLREAHGTYVAITDDDSEPEPDWLERFANHWDLNPTLGGVGGRDVVTLDDGTVLYEPQVAVGLISFTGRMIGGHHCGFGGARMVNVLKGVNCAYRRTVLQEIGFDKRLLGVGAQTHWEVSLCRQVVQKGYHLLYDPNIRVVHHIGIRHDDDKRTKFNGSVFFNNAYNELVALGTAQSKIRVIIYFIASTLIGHKASPGFFYSLATHLIRSDRTVWTRTAIANRARMKAIRTLTMLS